MSRRWRLFFVGLWPTNDEADRAKWKAEQEKQRREDAIANTTGLRVLSAIGSAVPVRLLKRDLMFVIERLLSLMEEPRIEALARQHGIRQKRDDGGVKKTLTAHIRRIDAFEIIFPHSGETIGGHIVESDREVLEARVLDTTYYDEYLKCGGTRDSLMELVDTHSSLGSSTYHLTIGLDRLSQALLEKPEISDAVVFPVSRSNWSKLDRPCGSA